MAGIVAVDFIEDDPRRGGIGAEVGVALDHPGHLGGGDHRRVVEDGPFGVDIELLVLVVRYPSLIGGGDIDLWQTVLGGDDFGPLTGRGGDICHNAIGQDRPGKQRQPQQPHRTAHCYPQADAAATPALPRFSAVAASQFGNHP